MNRILLEVILIFGVAFAANLGYLWWKNKQQDIGYQKCHSEVVVETATKNQTIVENRKKAKHENQNRDRDALIRYVCKRGWVFDPAQCATYERQVRDGVR